LPGGGDFAKDEEGPVLLNLGGDIRLADVPAAQSCGDRLRKLRRRAAACGNRADQRHGDVAAGVD